MNAFLRILFACVIFLTFSQANAGGFEKHRQDVRDCLGYERGTDEAKSTFDMLIERFYQKELDQYPYGAGPRISKLRTKFNKYVPGFTTGKYTHRIVFHNGFKDGPSFSSLPLAMRLQLQKAANGDGWKQYETQLLACFRKVQSGFYKSIKRLFRRKYGAIITDDEQREALIRIIYYIHLLGDYEESANDYTQGCLLDYFELENDLCDALRKLGCGKTKSLEYRIKHTGSSDNAQRAIQVLKALKEDLPSLIKKNPALKEALWGR